MHTTRRKTVQRCRETLFQSDRYQELRQSCRSREEATAIEDTIAVELAAMYRQIKLQQQDPIVAQLNRLL